MLLHDRRIVPFVLSRLQIGNVRWRCVSIATALVYNGTIMKAGGLSAEAGAKYFRQRRRQIRSVHYFNWFTVHSEITRASNIRDGDCRGVRTSWLNVAFYVRKIACNWLVASSTEGVIWEKIGWACPSNRLFAKYSLNNIGRAMGVDGRRRVWELADLYHLISFLRFPSDDEQPSFHWTSIECRAPGISILLHFMHNQGKRGRKCSIHLRVRFYWLMKRSDI